MADAQAEEWLSIAAQDLASYPADIITDCCREARKICRHHSEIVPTLVELCDMEIARRRRAMRPRPAPLPETPSIEAGPLDMDFINSPGPMAETLRKLGLANGYLVENEDGSVSEAPDNAA